MLANDWVSYFLVSLWLLGLLLDEKQNDEKTTTYIILLAYDWFWANKY